MNTNIHFFYHISLGSKKCFTHSRSENKNTHFIFNKVPPSPRKSCRLWVNVEKYCRAGQDTDDNMAHAHCMLDN